MLKEVKRLIEAAIMLAAETMRFFPAVRMTALLVV
jgi:hypothetical protein